MTTPRRLMYEDASLLGCYVFLSGKYEAWSIRSPTSWKLKRKTVQSLNVTHPFHWIIIIFHHTFSIGLAHLPQLGTRLKMSSLFEYISGSYIPCIFLVDSSKGADIYRTVTRCFSLLLPPHPSLMRRADRCTVVVDVLSTVFKFPASFSDMLHSRYIVALHLYQVTLNFDGGNLFCP